MDPAATDETAPDTVPSALGRCARPPVGDLEAGIPARP